MNPLTLDLIRALAALAFTLGLIFSIGWAVRRYAPGLSLTPRQPQSATLKLREKLTLNATTTLHVVEDETHTHLIATTATSATLLSSSQKTVKKAKRSK